MKIADSPNSAGVTRYDAAGIADGTGLAAAPASLLLRHGSGRREVLAAGPAAEVVRHPANAVAAVVALPDSVLIPGLVNAHSHLDLTHIGPREPVEGGFTEFARVVIEGRRHDAPGIAESVRQGIGLCLAGGTVAVGDIAGTTRDGPSSEPWRILRQCGLPGVSFLEYFAMGVRRPAALDAVQGLLEDWKGSSDSGMRLGLQPHAPYSVDLAGYGWATEQAVRRGLPLSTHLAESPEERAFVQRAAGPIRDLLEELGVWDEAARTEVGHGRHPVEHLRAPLAAAPFLLAHVNDAPDEALVLLARSGASVAYCPRSSEYFRAERHFGPHRYRDMLAAGINVCLGTDSIINLPPSAGDERRGGISVLDEMRLLHRRDGTDPVVLLRMATLNGAAALGLDRSWFTLVAGAAPAGLVAVGVKDTSELLPPADRLMRSSAMPRLLLKPA